MNLLISSNSNPYSNLATEEFLLKYCDDDFLLLYINQPCVVVGKHQIAQKETNSEYLFTNKILVARRLSGGGSVYHDEGNLNFSFIQTTPFGENVSYTSITQPIIDFLLSLGLDVVMSERNDILLQGGKISGSAMHIFKNRVIAHGTLLINSNLNNLSMSLRGNPQRYTDRSIASNRSRVINLAALHNNLNAKYIMSSLADYMNNYKGFHRDDTLLSKGEVTIQELATNKYSTSNWIYGYSPKYTYQSELEISNKLISYRLGVEKGIIVSIQIEEKDEMESETLIVMNRLTGKKHNYINMKQFVSEEFNKLNTSNLLQSLF